MVEINWQLRNEIRKKVGGLDCCFQCGTCTSSCPLPKYKKNYNPRKFLLLANLGINIMDKEELWYCSTCYLCQENCPQDVKPTDLLISLKNFIEERGEAPKEIRDLIDRIKTTGRANLFTEGINTLRKRMGLNPISTMSLETIFGYLENMEE